MRIVGGEFRGRALSSVGAGDQAAHLRPTTDRVRESLFNLLAHGGYAEPALPQGCRVLDLFAGTGALGLEALSRGAERVFFIDDGAKSRAIIRNNVDLLGVIGQVKLFRRDATRMGPNRGAGFDLVFLDPPYGKDLGAKALASCVAGGWLSANAIIIWEENTPQAVPEGLIELDQRAYGDTSIQILRYEG